jgi:hypothetical protein
MAIDSKAKRFSMLNFGEACALLPDPDGSFDQADRQHWLGLYSGILASVGGLSGTLYWDATLGSDGNDGSIGSPYQTVSVLNNAPAIAAGTTMNFKKGSSFGEVDAPAFDGSSGSPITMQAYGSGDDPIFTADTDAAIKPGGDYWTLSNLRLTGGKQPGNNDSIGGGIFADSLANLTLTELSIDNCKAAGGLFLGCTDLTITDCDVADITRADNTKWLEGDGWCFRENAGGTGCSGTLSGGTVTDAERQLVCLIGVSDLTITGGLALSGPALNGIDLEPNPDHTVENVTISGITINMTSGGGITADGTDSGATVDTVAISDVSIDLNGQADGRGLELDGVTGVTCNEVSFVDCDVDVWVRNSTATVKHCLMDDTAGTLADSVAFTCYQGATLTALGNEIRRHKKAVFADANASSNAVLFYNNTVAGLRDQGIRSVDSATVTAKNNVFDHAGGAGADTMIYDATGNGTYDYNDFWSRGAEDAGQFYDGSWHATLAAWQASSSQDANSIEDDPVLSDVDNDEYWPVAGSPCLDSGLDLGDTYKWALSPGSAWPSSVVLRDRDIYGWDIGAYVGRVNITSDTITTQSEDDESLLTSSHQQDKLTNYTLGSSFATGTDVILVE